MAKHRAISSQSVKARTVLGGAIVSGALLVGVPAGMATAAPKAGDDVTNLVASNRNPRDAAIGAVINRAISHLPPDAQRRLGETVANLPPRAQAEVIKAAQRLGIRLGGTKAATS
jgi:hypothetical protein